MKLIVLKPFKDKNDHQTIYKSGDHLITSELSRVNDLVKRGLCEIASVDDGDDSGGQPYIEAEKAAIAVKGGKDCGRRAVSRPAAVPAGSAGAAG